MKVFLNMVGCRLNQAEIEQLALSLTEAGVEVVADPKEADEIVINTCCVTAKASADSRKMLRHHKALVPDARVIGTGCWVSVRKVPTESETGMLDQAYTNVEKDQILEDLLEKASAGRGFSSGYRPDLGSRRRTRGFVKVQDGCDNRCAYCLTRIARGKSVSTDDQDVVRYAQKLQSLGVKEIVLTGVQLGSWGKDLEKGKSLPDLVELLLRETDFARIRLSSIEPWDVTQRLMDLFTNSRLCPHLHMPLQSGSDEILRKMSRPMDTERFRDILTELRSVKAGIAITTDVICGFPGETEELFGKSLAFVEDCQFSGGHVFSFSGLEGTSANEMLEQVQNSVRKERTALMTRVLSDAEKTYTALRLGKRAEVLFESYTMIDGEKVWQGWSEDYLRVLLRSPRELHNQIVEVDLLSLASNGGVIAGELHR